MKLSTNKKELIKLYACEDGFETFVNVHSDNDALLSQCLKSNGWDDVWWLISNTQSQFSDSQKKDLRLLGCDWADSVLHIFEKEHPEDKRPRLAIKAARDFANGLISSDELAAARAAARAAAIAAASDAAIAAASDAAIAAARAAAMSAAMAAARAAAMTAASDAAIAAAIAAARAKQKEELMELFLKWESQ